MHIEITPEPSPDEREALIKGLERLLAHQDGEELPSMYGSAWREAGLLEAIGEADPPRSPRL